jgi:ribosomal protein L7/L12
MSTHQLFHCPNCNAGLDLEENGAAIVRCDYCHSAVIVPESLRAGVKSKETPKKADPKKTSRPPKPVLTEENAIAKVTELARSDKEIEAMKIYRETYPVGLKETKEAIGQVAMGLPLPIPEARWEDEEELPYEAAEEITRLAAAGQLDEAAGLYRITFGTSHVEARTAVNQLVEGKSIDVARQKARKEMQATAVLRKRPEAATPGSYKVMGVGLIIVILFVVFVVIALALIFAF